MASIEYKILFEVRFLHDYYLYGSEPASVDKTPKSFFSMSTEGQALRLSELLKNGRYDIRKDLDFIISPDEDKLFKNLRMKFVKTETGFFLGMQVKRVVSGSGEIRFQPFISPPENAHVTVGISIVNPSFVAFSNIRLDKDEGNIYYFTNNGVHHDFSLASPVKPIVTGQQYRMGDLALIAGGIQQANADNTGNIRFWSTRIGQGLIHQGDRQLSKQVDWYGKWKSTMKMQAEHPLGVIKIDLMNNKNKKFNLINEEGLLTTGPRTTIKRLTHPIFELRCSNRSTYWRYRTKDGFSEKEKKNIIEKAGSFLTDEGSQFVTKHPWPIISERPVRMIPESSFQLPYAQPGAIKMESGKIFSDIEFNDLNPAPKGS